MKAPRIIPTPQAIGREALLVLGGAILAAAIIGLVPGLRAWIKQQWEGPAP